MRSILPAALLVLATSCGTTPDSSIMSANDLLAVDLEYQALKREQAWSTFGLAKKRLDAAPAVPPFARYVAIFDALSITAAVRADWLQSEQRKEYLKWREHAERELVKAVETVEKNIRPAAEAGDAPKAQDEHVEEASRLVEEALREARQEDLTRIDAAEPNGLLQKCLEKCSRALVKMQRAGEQGEVADLRRWEGTLKRVNEATTALRNRQAMRYSLWAERVYRVCSKKTPATDRKLERFYTELGRIDIGLVREPALARGITLRMHELYEKLTPQAKTAVRYKSIMQMEARRRLEEF